MKRFYTLKTNFKRSMIEIEANIPYWDIDPYFYAGLKTKMPNNVKFKVVKGKKQFDKITSVEGMGEFYSQKFIDILSEFYDMSEKCYPLDIEGVSEKYYNFYNLETADLLNGDYCFTRFGTEPWIFLLPDSLDDIICLKETYIVVISEEAKKALEKAKITNVGFIAVYGCSMAEKEEWEKDHEGMPLPLSETEAYDAWKEKYKEKYIKWDNPDILIK